MLEVNNELFKAAEDGRTEVVKFLLRAGADVNAQNSEGYTPLQNASLYGSTKAVKLLIEADANVGKTLLGGR